MGPKCPSVVPFKILHSEGPFEVASFEHFGLERPFHGGHDCFHSEAPLRGQYKSRLMAEGLLLLFLLV